MHPKKEYRSIYQLMPVSDKRKIYFQLSFPKLNSVTICNHERESPHGCTSFGKGFWWSPKGHAFNHYSALLFSTIVQLGTSKSGSMGWWMSNVWQKESVFLITSIHQSWTLQNTQHFKASYLKSHTGEGCFFYVTLFVLYITVSKGIEQSFSSTTWMHNLCLPVHLSVSMCSLCEVVHIRDMALLFPCDTCDCQVAGSQLSWMYQKYPGFMQ